VVIVAMYNVYFYIPPNLEVNMYDAAFVQLPVSHQLLRYKIC
jgi:hypothetical protein